MKLNYSEIVTLRDCLGEDIVTREAQIKSGFTTEVLDRPIIEARQSLKNKLNRYIKKQLNPCLAR